MGFCKVIRLRRRRGGEKERERKGRKGEKREGRGEEREENGAKPLKFWPVDCLDKLRGHAKSAPSVHGETHLHFVKHVCVKRQKNKCKQRLGGATGQRGVSWNPKAVL